MEEEEIRFKFPWGNFAVHTHILRLEWSRLSILDRKKERKNYGQKICMKSTREGKGEIFYLYLWIGEGKGNVFYFILFMNGGKKYLTPKEC